MTVDGGLLGYARDGFHNHPHHHRGAIVFLDAWGDAIRWACGHEMVVIGQHVGLLWHGHRCPICEPGANDCGIVFAQPMPTPPKPRLEI